MKCPQCGFLCSDLRDVCGKCFVDLRPRKEELGIKIINPTASHDALVSKIARKVEVHNQAQSGVLGALKSFFGPPKPIVTWEALSTSSVGSTTSTEKFTPASKVKSAPAQPAPVSVTPPQPTTPQIAKSADPQKRAHPFLHAKQKTSTPANSSSTLPLDSGAYNNLALDELWELSAAAVQSKTDTLEIEIATSLLRDYTKEKEEIEILWALSDESIIDPEAYKRYKQVTLSDSRTVKAETASKLLQKVEQTLTAPLFSLRRGGVKVTKRDDAEFVNASIRIPTRKIDIPLRSERLYAAGIDIIYMGILAAFLSFGTIWFVEPTFRPTLLHLASAPTAEQVGTGGIFLIFLTLVSFLYPWFAGTRTAGQKLLGLEIVEISGKEASQRELFLRSALLPASALLTVIIPQLWKSLGFHDRLARTVVTRVAAQQEV